MSVGKVVCSVQGRDKGRYMIAFGCDGDFLLLCDGKERPIERPKRKNIKHLYFTDFTVDTELIKSNKAIRKKIFSLFGKYKEESICQKKI